MPTIDRDDLGREPALSTWNPWSLLSMFDDVERSLRSTGTSTSWPMFDVQDVEDAVILVGDLPGMTEDQVDVTVEGPMLTISGERARPNGRYLIADRPYGRFARQFRLGPTVDADGIEAQFRDGVLMIRLPKSERARPRKVQLGAGGGVVDKVKGLFSRDKDQRGEPRTEQPQQH